MPPVDYCLFWIDHWSLCMNKSEWSGWVQAVGAVLAIVVGAVAVWWQVRKARLTSHEFQRANDVRLLALIATANVGCIKALKLAKLQLDHFVVFGRTIDGFNAHCMALAQIPLLQIPNVWVAMSIGRAVQERERLPERMRDVAGDEQIIKAIDLSLQEFLECERVVGVALAEMGARIPYGRIEIGADTVLHEAPESVGPAGRFA